MDAAQYQRVADQLGVGDVERTHELACARYDVRRLPETVHGRNEFEIAADALTAARALPRRPPLKEVRVDLTPPVVERGGFRAGRQQQAVEARVWWLRWWLEHRARQEALGRF